MTKPSTIATTPEPTWSQTTVDCKIDYLLMSVILVVKEGIITEITVARLSATAKMLRNPCIIRFLFLVRIL